VVRAPVRGGRLFCMLAAAAGMAAGSHAQPYPNKPIRLILPVPPGGVGDLYARPTTQKLSEILGQPVVIDHRPGATGTIGAALAARATPDGYTLLWGSTNSLAMGSALVPKLSYDPVKDFAPITPVVAFPNILVVGAGLGLKSAGELVELARAKPGRLNFASSGAGSTNHLTAALFETMAKVKLTHVHYKGGGPALVDLMGGHVEAMFATVPSAVAHVRGGRLLGLMVTSATRAPALPAVASAKEAGLPEFIVSNWNGILAPAGTPAAIVAQLNAAIVKLANSQDMLDRMAAQATDVYTTSPQKFAQILRDDYATWGKVIREIGVRAAD
jgi:tripartite-type tricarboxylate transporter receptor subunit TctC